MCQVSPGRHTSRRTPDKNAKLHDDAGSTPHAAGSRPRRRFGSAAQRESRSVSAGGVVWQSCQHRRKLLIPKGGPLAQLGERRVRNATGVWAKTPINPVSIDQIAFPKYSEVHPNRLAEAETAGTPAGTARQVQASSGPRRRGRSRVFRNGSLRCRRPAEPDRRRRAAGRCRRH